MKIPFTIDQFLGVFEAYNLAIQPAQIMAYLLGAVVVVAAFKGGKYSGKIVFFILAILWAWVGIVYHLIFFREINPAAYLFGILYIIQSILFVYAGFKYTDLQFKYQATVSTAVGVIFMVYALIIYPVLNYSFGHAYPKMPVFGVTPCPLTIFTFGILLCSTRKVPLFLIAIPFIWSIIGLSAAMSLKIVEDFGLIIAGVVGALLIAFKPHQATT